MSQQNRKGFTLVELAVVIVIIGVLAAFGVPQFLKSVERSKAAEAFNYLSAVRAAQERFLAKNGIYWSTAYSGTDTLDITQSTPKYFDVGDTTETHLAGKPTWTCTMTRNNSSSYAYTVIFTQNGYNTASTISAYPEINPLGAEVASAASSSSP